MCGIYCIENTATGQKYIGQSVDIKRRFVAHRCALNNETHPNSHLQRSWNKYGPDMFNFYIICECEDIDLDEQEIYYITYFDTLNENFGFNMQGGGQATHTITEEVKKKIGDANRGHKHTDESKQKMSVSRMGHPYYGGGQPNGFKHTEDAKQKLRDYNLGKTLSGETRSKISDGLKGIVRSNETKALISQNHANKHKVYCPQLNEYFDSIAEAKAKYGVSNINKCLSGERKSAGKHPDTGEKLTWEEVENS